MTISFVSFMRLSACSHSSRWIALMESPEFRVIFLDAASALSLALSILSKRDLISSQISFILSMSYHPLNNRTSYGFIVAGRKRKRKWCPLSHFALVEGSGFENGAGASGGRGNT